MNFVVVDDDNGLRINQFLWIFVRDRESSINVTFLFSNNMLYALYFLHFFHGLFINFTFTASSNI